MLPAIPVLVPDGSEYSVVRSEVVLLRAQEKTLRRHHLSRPRRLGELAEK